nr:hypothetical protein [Tanacetum cinerariifolium]
MKDFYRPSLIERGGLIVSTTVQRSIHHLSGSLTPSFDPIVESLSPLHTLFKDSDSLLEETDTLLSQIDDSFFEYETFCFNIEEKSSGSTTTHYGYSLLDYKTFYFDDDRIEEQSSGSTTTHSDFSLPEYDSFIFDLLLIRFLLSIGVTYIMRRPGHPNNIYYSDSNESDAYEPSKVIEVQRSIHHLSGSLTPSFDPIVESLSPLPTLFEDSDSLLEETDTLLSQIDDSFLEYETFCFNIEEKSSGKKTPLIKKIPGSKTLSSFSTRNDRKVLIPRGSVRKRGALTNEME